ncbi:formyltransferase [Paludibacterium yongneupense]|uniref:formyltransferase n=1 Tax=Paludibacterium yongneupense TaxID=400061 RepID=UPI000403C598|nr:formyltransferase [Paludibacterium yongneupense]
MTRAVVFAYHTVGVRCLKALLGRGVEVALVITHRDNPNETIWFDSVERVAREYDIPTLTPDDPNTPEVLAAVRAAQPDFLFSFYYRHMIKQPLLDVPARGAFNMHGSLLPQYRGRVPINWAIIHGESETGATLHVMNAKPDNGAIVDQMAVPVFPDDNAQDVFAKVVTAAEMVLWRSLPALESGTASMREQDLSLGGYFGGRKPEDGRLDGTASARRLHDFVRALAQPYPGAFADVDAGRLVLWRTRIAPGRGVARDRARLLLQAGRLCLEAADGGVLYVLAAELNGVPLDAARFQKCFISGSVTI